MPITDFFFEFYDSSLGPLLVREDRTGRTVIYDVRNRFVWCSLSMDDERGPWDSPVHLRSLNRQEQEALNQEIPNDVRAKLVLYYERQKRRSQEDLETKLENGAEHMRRSRAAKAGE